MAARAGEAPRTLPPRARRRAATGSSALRRWLFVFALLTCAITTGWTATGLLARVTPALFPSRTLPGVSTLNSLLPGPVQIDNPDEDSFFRRRRNLLVIGLDKRPGWEFLGRYLTDTIMVATIDPNSNRGAVLSFPRDLYVTHYEPDGSIRYTAGGFAWQGRINESYGIGVGEGNTFDAGAQQLATDLEYNFGISIDQWIILDFKGVETLVDAIGGIDITIPDDLAVYNWYYSDDDQTADYISIPAGEQHLNGYEAVAFGRYRDDPKGDLNRVKRQELVLQTAFRQAFEGDMFGNALELWDAYNDVFETNIGTGSIPGYALMLKDLQGDLETYSIADPVDGVETVFGFTTAGGASVLGWHSDNVQYWLRKAFTETAYANSNVEIWDGSGDAGGERAFALARYLDFARGLPSVYVGPSVEQRTGTTIVLYGDGKREMAEDIAEWIGAPLSAIDEREANGAAEPDVVIIVGSNFVIPGG